MNKTARPFYWIMTLLFLLGLWIELRMQTFAMNDYGVFNSPLVWLAGGLLSCIAAFALLWMKGQSSASPLASSDNKLFHQLLTWGLFGLAASTCASLLAPIFAEYPSDPQLSDILPSLELYVRRWLGGELVYKPMEFPGWTVNPTYFPLLWMPYAFSEILQIDYRWTAYGVFLLALFFYNRRLLQMGLPIWELLIKTLLPFAMLYAFISYQPKVFGFAVELLPVGFYLILTLTTWHRSNWVMAIGILVCLLSRYAFTFWLPVYLLVLWIDRGFRTAFSTGLWVLLGVILLYVLPFLSRDVTILTKGLQYYGKTAEGQWYPQSWQQPNDIPHHLNQGLSFAMYFYSNKNYTVPDRLKSNRKFHLTACGFAALLILLGYFVIRRRGLDIRLYLLIGLKFYLLIFYGFFYVPFSYLYMLPLFISIALFNHIPIRPPKSVS
ncbi:MAG: hypothetical protein AAF990_22895 [Bacteroidota bacterium]